MQKLDFDVLLKNNYPELGDNPIETLEKEYSEVYKLKVNKSDEFNAEYFESLRELLWCCKIVPYLLSVLDKAMRRENLGKEAKGADNLIIDPKHKVSSPKMFTYLKSLDEDSIRSIIGGVTDDPEEFDALSEAIELDDKDMFVTIVHKYKNVKLHNICASKIAIENDIIAINEKMASFHTSTYDDNDEDIASSIYDNIKESTSYSYSTQEVLHDLDDKAIMKILLQIINMKISIIERKLVKQYFEDPVVKSIFDGSEYISDSRPNVTIQEFLANNPVAAKILPIYLNIDISELTSEQSQDTIKVVTATKTVPSFRSMLIGSDEERDAIIAKLTKYIDDKGKVAGARLAQLVIAANELGWLITPDNTEDFHREMVNTFGDKLGGTEALRNNLKEYEIFVRLLDSNDCNNNLYNKAKVNQRRINDIKAALMKTEEQQ